MQIGGNVREVKEFTKYAGIFKGELVAINPTRSQLNKLLKTTENRSNL